MSTCWKDKQKLASNDSFHHHADETQFKNLNLNHQSGYYEVVEKSDTVCIGYDQKVGRYKHADMQINDRRGENDCWNRDWKGFKTSKLPTLSLNHLESDDYEKTKKIIKDGTSKNSSTLSLHIAAYENSPNAAAATNGFSNEKINAKNLKQSKYGGKTWKGLKKIVFGAAPSMNLFEIPRQQEDNNAAEPEVMQFHANQQLLNPNQQNQGRESMEESDSTGEDDEGFVVVVTTSRKKEKNYHVMHIPSKAINCEKQYACVSKIHEQPVTFNGRTVNVEYQMVAYPKGYANDSSQTETPFNVVIQLVKNPLNAVLKASYKIYFTDRHGKKHVFNDKKEGERTIDKRTAAQDIHLMPLAEFKDIMDSFGNGQTIFFRVTFTAITERGPYNGSKNDEIEKKWTLSFPDDLSNIPNIVRCSDKYFWKGTEFQFRLFMDQNKKLWIDFYEAENPKEQKVKFDVLAEADGHKLLEVPCIFGNSYRSNAVQLECSSHDEIEVKIAV